MNTIFTNIYSNINKIYSSDDIFWKNILPEDILKWLFLSDGIELGEYISYKFNISNVDIHLVKTLECNIDLNCICLNDSKPCIVCIMPYDIYTKSHSDQIRIIYNIYLTIIQYICRKDFQFRLKELEKYAPKVLTIFTILSFNVNVNADLLIDKSDNITNSQLEEIIENDISDLLDYGALLSIMQ